VYTFHEKETMLWHFSEDNFHYKYLNESSSPYHLDAEGTIVGFGKKVRIVNKAAKLTVCEVISNQWVFVGDDKGSLHVYDWKFLSHVKTFSEHQGPILAIKIDEESNSVYFTGSDSKIGMIRLVNEEWKLGVSVRGQSHDILGLERFGKYLISGGVTTDLCFYPLDQGELTT
jgi:WD40 repeat protein